MYKVRCVIVDCWTAHQPFSTSLNNNSSPPLSYNWCTSRVLNHFRRFPYQNMHRQINKKARKKNRTRQFNSFLFQVEMWGGHSAPFQRAPTDLHITAFNGEILFYTLANILPIRRFKIIERARHYENKHPKTGGKKENGNRSPSRKCWLITRKCRVTIFPITSRLYNIVKHLGCYINYFFAEWE
jgi:hypothetical protein